MNKILKITDERFIKVIQTLKEAIKSSAFEGKIYLCGECVRDFILGQTPSSLTFITETKSDDFAKHLKDANIIHAISQPLGFAQTFTFSLKDCETVRLCCSQVERKDDSGTEITNINGDAKLRKITIDALYYNISTDKILDPTGDGLHDLSKHVIKSPLEPTLVFKIYPMNMIYIIRKAGEYHWGIEKYTWFGIIECARQASNIKVEDFANELTSILKTAKPSIAILKLYYSGLLEYCFKDFDFMHSIVDDMTPEKTLLAHTLNVVDAVDKTDIIGRYAALFHDYGKIVTTKSFRHERTPQISAQFAELALCELKLPLNTIKRIVNIIGLTDFFERVKDCVTPSPKLIRKFMSKAGDDFASCLSVIQAENTSRTKNRKPTQVKKILERYEEMLKSENETKKRDKLPVNGNDLKKAFFLSSGEIIGQVLAHIQTEFDENPDMTKEECLAIAGQFVKYTYAI